ncbi:EIIAB-Man [Kingella potus]|uniref:EIIAB-Man n=2 Tax=Kingella potus TaxID=265175 RepID=A0A377R0M4_9NEIS|nr:PTS mannose transporter subunit IIA [Kingella potus]STR00817.1 EIIAB-Man [Kingella potus]
MIGIIIVTHETLGKAYAQLADHFFSEIPECVRILGVERTEDHESIIRRTCQMIGSLGAPHGVLVLTDIFGATPCNAARKLVVPQQVAMLTGLNAPMLIKAVQYCGSADNLEQFTESVRLAALNGIIAITRPPEAES